MKQLRAPLRWRVLAASASSVILFTAALSAQGVEWQSLPGYETDSRAYPAAAMDLARGVTVQFGGVSFQFSDGFDDTWEWDGTRWRHVWTASAPPPRRDAGMAFDPVRKTVILFGGRGNSQQFGDTWEWDGRSWKKLSPASSPSSRSGHAMVTDVQRGRILLFGGWTGSPQNPFGSASDETWEWDGKTWVQLHPSTRPWARWGHAMAQDPGTGEIVMLRGGNPLPFRETYQWHWNGKDWRQVTPRSMAPDSTSAQLAVVGSKLVLHGAYDRPIGPDHAWSWDGQTWTEHKTPVTPGVSGNAGFVTEPGGQSAITIGLRDTWRWDGNSWAMVSTDLRVPGGETQMAYDPDRDEILVVQMDHRADRVVTWALRGEQWVELQPTSSPPYGGLFAGMQYHAGLGRMLLQIIGRTRTDWVWDRKGWTLSDSNASGQLQPNAIYDPHRQKIVVVFDGTVIFEWDANGWVQRSVSGGPAGSAFAVAYDVARRRIVCFGGMTKTSLLDETWEWDGARWHQLKPVNRPPARSLAKLVYSPVLGGCVLFGGIAGRSTLPDTWLWDGRDWRKLPVQDLPSRSQTSVWPMRNATYDAGRRRVLGQFSGAEHLYPRTWELVVPALTTPQRYPRPGESIDLDVGLPNAAGRPFALVLSGSQWPGIPLRPITWMGSERLPIAADALFGVSAQVGLGGTLDGQGRLRVSIPVPNNPWLWWTELHAAGLSLSTAGLGEVTNAQEIRIVR